MQVMSKSVDISVQQLHSFRHVYEQRGYAAAARVSGLSVPTVWQHIQALERIYGVALFEKQGRHVQSTAAAARLYGTVDEVLEGLESSFEVIHDQSDDSQSITLVTGVRMMMEDLSKPLKAFRREFRNQLSIRHGNNRRAEELLLEGEADLALSLEASSGAESAMLVYEPAYFVDFLAIAPKSHPFHVANTANLKELVKHPLIVTAPGTHGRDALEQALFRERLKANITIETDNSGFTIACVQAGLGLGIVAGRADGQLGRNLKARSLRKQLGRRQIVVMWRKGRRLTQAMQQLVACIRNANLSED